VAAGASVAADGASVAGALVAATPPHAEINTPTMVIRAKNLSLEFITILLVVCQVDNFSSALGLYCISGIGNSPPGTVFQFNQPFSIYLISPNPAGGLCGLLQRPFPCTRKRRTDALQWESYFRRGYTAERGYRQPATERNRFDILLLNGIADTFHFS
jgi:hypothetical protein